MKQLFIKFIAIVYLFVVAIPLTTIVYLTTSIIFIILYLKKKTKEKREFTIPNEWLWLNERSK